MVGRRLMQTSSKRSVGTAVRGMVLTLVGVSAAACVVVEPGGPGRFGPGPGGVRVEGNWAPSSGVAIATFQNGAFINRAVDTGQPFTAGGRYAYAGPDRVAISYTSLVRQTQVNVDCLVVNPAQMDCATADGNQFSLFRRA